MRRLASDRVVLAAAILVGFALRALFVLRHPPFNGDALVYGELAHHVLKEHVYGLIDAGVLRPTLIRLPGYPLFLAAVFKVFGDANYLAVIWVQVFVDLATCLLLAATAARVAGRDYHEARLPHIPGDRHHRLLAQRRTFGVCAADGGARECAHDEALRPPQ